MKEFEEYTLTIMGSRRIYLNFNTLDELKEAVSEHLTPGEIREGAYTGSNLPAARRISARWPEKTCHPAGRVRQ